MRGLRLRAGWLKLLWWGSFVGVAGGDRRPAGEFGDRCGDRFDGHGCDRGLFGDHNLWDALQSSVVGLVGEVLGDSSVQSAVSDQVQQLVSSPRSAAVPSAMRWVQVGAAVVGLMTNSVIGEGC